MPPRPLSSPSPPGRGRPAPERPEPVTAADWPALAARLRAARPRLAGRPLAERVRALAAAARRALRQGPARRAREAALATSAGFSPAMARLAYEEAFRALDAKRLRTRLRAEFTRAQLADPAWPEASAAGVGAAGPELALVVAAGNVPVAALPSVADLLLLGSAVVWRTARDEPVIGPAFAASLAETAPDLAGALAVVRWEREDAAAWRAAFASVDTAVVYGGAAALAALTDLAPPSLAWVEYGPRLSAAHVGREALAGPDGAAAAARALALDVALYDQRGCLSPQFAFVETGAPVSPGDFAAALAAALGDLASRLPAGPVSEGAAASILRARAAAEFAEGAEVWVPEGGGASWTVVLRRGRARAGGALPLSPGGRFITLVEVENLDEALDALEPFAGRLSALGLAPAPDRARDLPWPRLARLGVSRVVPLGRMQFPDPDWPHDGRPNLAPLLRRIKAERASAAEPGLI